MSRICFTLLGLCTLELGCFDIQPRAQMCSSPLQLPQMSQTVTYHQDVEPILAARCVQCHSPAGIGPFSLQTYDQVGAQRQAIQSAVVTQHMPPWPPAHCCATYRDDRSMTPNEIATISTWIDQGALEGTPAPATPPTPRPTLQADTSMQMPTPYTPQPPAGAIDDTRCFLLDWPATEIRYVTGTDIQSIAPQQVHHALVLTASKDQAAQLQQLQGRSDGPGWPCPGGLVEFKDFLGGSFFEPQIYDDGTGHEIDPGDKIILTVHYSQPASGTFVPDQTTVMMRTQTQPVTRIHSLTIYDPGWVLGGMPIPPGAPDVVYSYADQPGLENGGQTMLLRSVSIHMHERGQKGQLTIIRANGQRECLLQIDDWHHGWQGEYRFDQPKTLGPNDQILVECHFNNTASHQRIINGQPETPKWLNWGEGQEMCAGFVMATPE